MRLTWLATVAAVLGVGLSAVMSASASASTTIGETSSTQSQNCNGTTWVQDTTGAAPGYEVPAGGGVITSYSIFAKADTATSQFFFKVLARTGSTFQVVGSDGPHALVPNHLNTFQTSIPVRGGELLGEWFPSSDVVPCDFFTKNPDDAVVFAAGASTPNPGLGDTVTLTTRQTGTRLNLSAVVGPLTPQLSNLTQSATNWIRGSALPSARTAGATPPVGTTFGFMLDRPARVQFLFTYRAIGRRVGGGCVVQTSRNRGRARCLRTVRVAFSRQAPAGRTRVHFEGRLDRKRKLPPGRFKLIITATANGRHSEPGILRFTILR